MASEQPTKNNEIANETDQLVENPQRRKLIKKLAKAAVAIPTAIVIFRGPTQKLQAYG